MIQCALIVYLSNCRVLYVVRANMNLVLWAFSFLDLWHKVHICPHCFMTSSSVQSSSHHLIIFSRVSS